MDLVQFEEFPYVFDPAACRACAGFCCRGKSGNIWVNAEEIEKIGSLLHMSQIDVIGRCLNPVGNRLSIKEKYVNGHYECVFFDGKVKNCSIYSARPTQCRRFPFWSHYRGRVEEVIDECPGVRLPG